MKQRGCGRDRAALAVAVLRCSAFRVISQHPDAGAVLLFVQQPYKGQAVPTTRLLLRPEAEGALSPTCGEDPASSHRYFHQGFGGKRVGLSPGLMEEAAQGPQGWGFRFAVSWALPRSCPDRVCALRDAVLPPGPVLTPAAAQPR